MASDAQMALQVIRDQGDNPNLPMPACWNPEYPLRKYQRVGVSYLLVMKRFVLGHCVGCHEIGQKILMHSGELRSVEDVQEGDLLMGPDSLPRTVVRLIRGFGKLFRVVPKNGKNWVVNEDHMLTLRLPGNDSHYKRLGVSNPVIDVSVRDWFKWSHNKKANYKLFKVGVDSPEIYESGIADIVPERQGAFYGFTLDGDGRYLLDDLTVTHNSGKTIMGLNAWGIFREKRPSRLFVVTTTSAVSQWCEECDKFLPGVPYVEVPSSEDAPCRERERYYQDWVKTGMGSMLCLSWSQYQRDWEFFLETQDLWKEGTWVILDECQRVRNPKSKLYKITQELSEIVPRIHGFTATLINNKAHDALHILNLLNPGTMSLIFFNKSYVVQGLKKVPMRTGKGGGRRFITVKTVEGYQNLQDFAAKVSHLYLSPPESEMDLERPAVQTISRRETMSHLHRRIYTDAERGLFLTNCEDDVTAASSALAHAQIATSSPEHFTDASLPLEVDTFPGVFNTDLSKRLEYNAAQDKNSKLNMLKDLLSTELEDTPVIIYSPFATSIWHLKSALAKYNPVVITGSVKQADRDQARLDFQEGRSNVILLTDAGGEALNLQRARHVIFYSLPWTVGKYVQLVGRARRFGSQHQYLGVWHLIMKDSVDELVESILKPKAIQFETLLSSEEPVADFSGSLAIEVARRMRKSRITN
jgi:superfamily II DNA or RNA helicase